MPWVTHLYTDGTQSQNAGTTVCSTLLLLAHASFASRTWYTSTLGTPEQYLRMLTNHPLGCSMQPLRRDDYLSMQPAEGAEILHFTELILKGINSSLTVPQSWKLIVSLDEISRGSLRLSVQWNRLASFPRWG